MEDIDLLKARLSQAYCFISENNLWQKFIDEYGRVN